MVATSSGDASPTSERRGTHKTRGVLDPVQGTLWLLPSALLILPALWWVGGTVVAMATGRGNAGLLIGLPLPLVVLGVAIFLGEHGLGRVRGAVTWLDRRRHGDEGPPD